MVEQVGPPVQHPDVDEPGQGVQRAVPTIGLYRGGEERGGIRRETVERQDPAGGSEFWRPDYVELQDVGVTRVRVQPLHVELMALVGRIGRLAPLDTDSGMSSHEPVELSLQQFRFRPDRAGRERDDDAFRARSLPAPRGQGRDRRQGDQAGQNQLRETGGAERVDGPAPSSDRATAPWRDRHPQDRRAACRAGSRRAAS